MGSDGDSDACAVELELWSSWEGKKNREDHVMSGFIYISLFACTLGLVPIQTVYKLYT